MTQAIIKSYNPNNADKVSEYVTTAVAASAVVKSSNGTLLGISVINSGASTRYFQIFDSTSVPADGAVPVLVLAVPSGEQRTLDLTAFNGKFCSTGISWASSSTLATKTIGAAELWVNIFYI